MRLQARRLSISRNTRRGSLSHSVATLSLGRNVLRTWPSSVRTTSPLTPPERTFMTIADCGFRISDWRSSSIRNPQSAIRNSSSPDLPPRGHLPAALDLAVAAVPDLVVEVDGRTHVAGD